MSQGTMGEKMSDKLRFVESRPMKNGKGIFIKTSDGRWARFHNDGRTTYGHNGNSLKAKTKEWPDGANVIITPSPM
jgi:hypothetical protein